MDKKRFGKMNGDVFEEYRGGTIKQDGRVHVNVRENTLLQLGFKEVEVDESPVEERDGFQKKCVFRDNGKKIKGSWEWYESESEV